ncbi:hypothetical protein ACTWPT_19685 [Nonomuraea sp. 3N208]|uniref:hypothetical protein n=1 Tax=Nonomuraea sp. 3N208 TaxID=3457421 RepID=UPI003FCD8934
MTHYDSATRGRRERPVPPGPLQDFAQGLRDLRAAAGSPSYRAMERKAGYSASALSAAAAGDRLPSLAVTQAYVGACGGDQDEWTRKWLTLRADLDKTHDAVVFPRVAGAYAPPAGLSRRRMVKLCVILVALGLAGLVSAAALRDGSTTQAKETQEPTAAPHQRPPAFTAVAGPSCPRDTIRTVRITGMSGRDGWKDASAPGWTGAGCGNSFLFSELTQNANARNTFQWRFTTGLRSQHQCLVAVYIPKSGLAGQRVWYTVRDGFDDDARTVAEFTLDQRMRNGTWVPAPVPIITTTGLVMVEITDTGTGNTTGNQSMAAGPIRLTCP